MRKVIALCLLTILFAVACNSEDTVATSVAQTIAALPTDTPLPTPEPTDTVAIPTPVPTDTPEPTHTPTPEPTATDEPTATSAPTDVPTDEPTATDEPTETPTETPNPRLVTVLERARLREGAGSEFDTIVIMEVGDTGEVVELTETSNWYKIIHHQSGEEGWVFGTLITIPSASALAELDSATLTPGPTFTPSPVPTATPWPTRTPTSVATATSAPVPTATNASGTVEPTATTSAETPPPDTTATPTNTPEPSATATATLEPFSCSNIVGIPVGECTVLETFYSQMGGAGWSNQSGWLSSNTACEWAHVTCAGGRVSALVFESGSGLGGTLSADIVTLSSLQRLVLIGNYGGQIPASYGELVFLNELTLISNGMSGVIPGSLDGLRSLTSLTIQGAGISGDLPLRLANLVAIQTLNISGTNIQGGIPSQFGNTTSLHTLILRNNGGLTGALPTNLTNLSLSTFDFSGTGLCEPNTMLFNDWFATIANLSGTGVKC